MAKLNLIPIILNEDPYIIKDEKVGFDIELELVDKRDDMSPKVKYEWLLKRFEDYLMGAYSYKKDKYGKMTDNKDYTSEEGIAFRLVNVNGLLADDFQQREAIDNFVINKCESTREQFKKDVGVLIRKYKEKYK